ncbi:MAG TPA: DNA-processing protein DprA [Methylomirabilota bacterium]|nr:DNA-processing protein DprA [Methylomirabilota bacterium]
MCAADDERWTRVLLAMKPEGPYVDKHVEARGETRADAGRTFDRTRALAEQHQRAAAVKASLVLHGEEGYPPHLEPIPSPPPFLFVRGRYQREDALALAIVGSRQPTPYGVRVAEQLAGELSIRGITILSGLARGIDTAAHRGALAAGGRTIAVLGSGVDVIYPPENRRLVDRLLEHGALVSQFPMGTPPLPGYFPARNRVISGMSLGTIVVEAAEKSGALITAGFAGELGRDVFAVPGNITSRMSDGTNRLIQDGAKLVRGWEDVVAELPDVWRRLLKEPQAAASQSSQYDVNEGAILSLLSDEPVSIDQLIRQSGLPSNRVSALLLELELKGLVRKAPGQCYTRAR